MESNNATPSSSAQRADEPDPRTSLRHVLAADSPRDLPVPDQPTPSKSVTSSMRDDDPDDADDSSSRMGPTTKAQAEQPMYTATTTTTRRNANGSVSSVYSGNKIRHLKKEDGVPLWRKDIQFDFLKAVFEDTKQVFHKASDGSYGHTFADIYLDAMAKSSKCSKILKEKLLTERPAALNMAMVCLLVNVGRMNTTLNFFPEMRAQLRTYHSIPSLQAHQDPNAYKQLQDAPRLKSILKGASEDTDQPVTLDEVKARSVPRTNPVNLIFILSQYAPKISEVHFPVPRDFFDLVMKSGLSSRSRATGFLWLMWWYLESDFSKKDALENPYGKGQFSMLPDGGPDPATDGLPIKLPPFEYLTDAQAALENVDTKEEKEYGSIKMEERLVILQTDATPVVTGPKRGTKRGFNNNPVWSVQSEDGATTPSRDAGSPAPSSTGYPAGGKRTKLMFQSRPDYNSDVDTERTRSMSPPTHPPPAEPSSRAEPMRIDNLMNDDSGAATAPPPAPASSAADPPAPAKKGPGRGNWGPRKPKDPNAPSRASIKAAENVSQSGSGSGNRGQLGVTGPHGFYLPLNGADPSHKRTRPLTKHQLDVERYRRERVEYILDRGLRKEHAVAKKRRRKEGAIARAWRRCALSSARDALYDSEEEMDKLTLSRERSPEKYGGDGRKAGLVGLFAPRESREEEDWGEEVGALAQGVRRAMRRLDRWEEGREVMRRKGRGKDEGREREHRDMDEGEHDDEEMDDETREMMEELDADETEDEIEAGA